METAVYVDACIRGKESRTKRIADTIVSELAKRYEIKRFVLNDLDLTIIKQDQIEKKNRGEYDPEVLKWAEAMRDADRVVIAAPFWDMSYPAALKNFLEACSIFDVTFKSNATECYGNCRAEKMLYITSRGMNISTGDPLEQATPYLKAISWLWGIKHLDVIAAQNMDYSSPEQVDQKIETAIKEGLNLVSNW